ncbi:MAG: L-lactate dehydrogenase [Sphingomonas bacterium]|nr:L-lactate dehydrogenase [Sphingomonas bacterium]
MTQLQRIAIIGAGHVGATTAYALMLRALVHEIVLIDDDAALATAEAADLSDANALARPARIWAGDYRDAANAQIAVLTAGAATRGDESRLAVAARSGAIVKSCVEALVGAGFSGILLVAANPVDLMALVALRASGLAPARVIGTGTLLDSARLRQSLATALGVAAASIDGFVLGEHGDSEVAAQSTVRIGGLSLLEFAEEARNLDFTALAAVVREAGYRIIEGKGYTSFGIATAIVQICEAIVRDEQAVLPVSAFLTGELGISDLYLSLPCIIGAQGIHRVLPLNLPADEQTALNASAAALGHAMEQSLIDPVR